MASVAQSVQTGALYVTELITGGVTTDTCTSAVLVQL